MKKKLCVRKKFFMVREPKTAVAGSAYFVKNFQPKMLLKYVPMLKLKNTKELRKLGLQCA